MWCLENAQQHFKQWLIWPFKILSFRSLKEKLTFVLENVASGEDPSSLRASWLNWAKFHNQCSYENDRRSFLAKLHQPGSHLCNVEHVQFYDVFSSENRWMIYRKKALDSIQYVTDKTMHSILKLNFQMENRRLWCLRLMQYCCNFEKKFPRLKTLVCITLHFS